jgi:hypothetical protein
MDQYFQIVHRIGIPGEELGDAILDGSEVEIPLAEQLFTRLLTALHNTDMTAFSDFIASKIIWLSPTIFITDSQGPFDFEFIERHGCQFLLDVMCGPSRQYPRDLAVSVCLFGAANLSTGEFPLDRLLQIIGALQPKALGVYGNLGKAVEGSTLAFPFSAAALSTFLESNRDFVRLHLSHFRLNKPQFDSLSVSPIPNLRLGYVEQEEAFPVALNVGLLEFDIGRSKRSCFWSLSGDCEVVTLVVRIRETIPAMITELDQEETIVVRINSLTRTLCNVQPVNLCMKVKWFTIPAAWELFCDAMFVHPTLRVIRLDEFFPQTGADERKKLCSQAVRNLVQRNRQLQQVEVPLDCRDERIWSKHIRPLLGLNKLRRRLTLLVGDKDLEDRRGVMGKAIFSLQSRKEQLYYLLRDTHCIVFG